MANKGLKNQLAWLNVGSKESNVQLGYLEFLKTQFNEVIALEIGSAYGGAVETMAKFLKGRGKAYGYDTFEGHPEDLSDDSLSGEARCMDIWYVHPDFGRGKNLSYKYQRKVLDQQGLDNAILVKGRINKHSFDDIKEAHLVMMDLDLVKSTEVAYFAVRGKIVLGGYLFMHDAIPANHLPLLHKFIYNEVVTDKMWSIEAEIPDMNLLILKHK